MKTLSRLLFCFGLLTSLQAQAQPTREFNQAELDALLAPVALYPDALLSQILVAATYPDQVAEAARGGQSSRWHPAVTALTAFPEVLARMAENPQWLRDLGEAYLGYEPYVMETVQQLRRRAEAAGNLQSDSQRQVVRQGETIVVQPVYPQVIYAPYYNPLVVFGTWWWTSYRPVLWRPWHARPERVVHVVRVVHRPPLQPAHHPVKVRPVQLHKTPVQVHKQPVQVVVRPASQPAPRPQAAPVVVRPHVVVRPQSPVRTHVTARPQVQHIAVTKEIGARARNRHELR
jgi:hypothetical protein